MSGHDRGTLALLCLHRPPTRPSRRRAPVAALLPACAKHTQTLAPCARARLPADACHPRSPVCPRTPTSNAQIMSLIHDKENAVISINTAGIIQTANKPAERMLGGLAHWGSLQCHLLRRAARPVQVPYSPCTVAQQAATQAPRIGAALHALGTPLPFPSPSQATRRGSWRARTCPSCCRRPTTRATTRSCATTSRRVRRWQRALAAAARRPAAQPPVLHRMCLCARPGCHSPQLSQHTPPPLGKVNVLDSLRELVIVHKDKYIMPIMIGVTRASGTGMESIFMAVFRVRRRGQAG